MRTLLAKAMLVPCLEVEQVFRNQHLALQCCRPARLRPVALSVTLVAISIPRTHEHLLFVLPVFVRVEIDIAADEAADEAPKGVLDVGAVAARQARDEAGLARVCRRFVDVWLQNGWTGELSDERGVQERGGAGACA